MTAAVRRPRTVSPVRCDLVVVRRMAYPCVLLPQGQPAHVSLNGRPYVVTCAEDAFTFHGEAGRSHVVCRGTCTCEDFVYVREARGELCKHSFCLARMQEQGAV